MFPRILATLRATITEPSLKRLRNRLLAVNLISLTLVVIVAFSLIYIDYYNRTQNEIERTLDSIPPGVPENIRLLQQTMAETGSGRTPDYNTTNISGGPAMPVDYSKCFVANVKNDGSITVFSMLDIKSEECFYAVMLAMENGASSGALNMAGRTWRYSIKSAADLPQRGIYNAYESSVVFLDINEASRGLRELALSLFIIGIVSIGAILLVSLLVANRAIRPVAESMARQRRFVADASHELKTPIAVIAANAEAAKDAVYRIDDPAAGDGENAESVTRWIDIIADEANRMDGLVKSLLALAKAEEMQVIKTTFDLYEAIREEAERVEVFLFEKNIAFVFEPPEAHDKPLLVYSDRTKVRSILSVLLENAVKYTPEGGKVTITAGRIRGDGSYLPVVPAIAEKTKGPKGDARVTLANTGEYIPPEDMGRVFDRFFRTDLSRNSETGGHGIGLSIAKEIAQALGGGLTASSVAAPDGGAVNTFTLYI